MNEKTDEYDKHPNEVVKNEELTYNNNAAGFSVMMRRSRVHHTSTLNGAIIFNWMPPQMIFILMTLSIIYLLNYLLLWQSKTSILECNRLDENQCCCATKSPATVNSTMTVIQKPNERIALNQTQLEQLQMEQQQYINGHKINLYDCNGGDQLSNIKCMRNYVINMKNDKKTNAFDNIFNEQINDNDNVNRINTHQTILNDNCNKLSISDFNFKHFTYDNNFNINLVNNSLKHIYKARNNFNDIGGEKESLSKLNCLEYITRNCQR